jgi:hypothetical protein
MSERTQIENELELLELEERQLLIERKRVELKQRLKAITTQDYVGLTIAGISPEVHQEQKQVTDEGMYSPEFCVQHLLILNSKGCRSRRCRAKQSGRIHIRRRRARSRSHADR